MSEFNTIAYEPFDQAESSKLRDATITNGFEGRLLATIESQNARIVLLETALRDVTWHGIYNSCVGCGRYRYAPPEEVESHSPNCRLAALLSPLSERSEP